MTALSPRVRDEERRICAGDWVRLVGSSASIRGIGKVVDADYDARDASLRLARVEFARGAHWFWPGDLRRIAADEEVRLCEAALEVARMPEPARDRVRAALIEPPRRATARSLGLLDLLWSLLGSLPGERAVSGLARFFDEGGPEKVSAPRSAAPEPVAAVAPPAPVELVAPPPAPRPPSPPEGEKVPAFEPTATLAALPRPALLWAPRHPSGEEAVAALLGTLNHRALDAIAERAHVLVEPRMAVTQLREKVRVCAEIHVILDTLTDNQLGHASIALDLEPSTRSSTTLRILQRAAPRSEGDLAKRLAISPLETRFLLGLLPTDELCDLAYWFGVDTGTGDEAHLIDRILEAAER